MAKICIEYECEVQESQRKPTNLLDALEQGDHRSGEDDAIVGEEKVSSLVFLLICDFQKKYIFIYVNLNSFLFKAHRLSTLCLQNDKRMDDELRGGKRKIKLVQQQVRAAPNGDALYQ